MQERASLRARLCQQPAFAQLLELQPRRVSPNPPARRAFAPRSYPLFCQSGLTRGGVFSAGRQHDGDALVIERQAPLVEEALGGEFGGYGA
jgi:hypothetical protein